MRFTVLFLFCIAAFPAIAQERLDGPSFDALLEGQTVTFVAPDGFTTAQEAYHPGRRVTWLHSADTCRKGRWYPQGEQICFLYEGSDTPSCTIFSHNNGTFVSYHYEADFAWTSIAVTTEPIACTTDFLGS